MTKIRRHIISLLLLLLAAPSAWSETVSQKAALQIAQTFFNALYGEQTARPKLVWNGRELTTNRLFTPFYIYDSPRGGFVAVSADTKAFPILAYSRTYKFDKSSLGEAERNQFTQFAREIELIRYDSQVPESAVKAWGDMPAYIAGAINNPYNTSEYERLTDEARDNLEELDRRNSWIIMPSAIEFDLYNPEQYRDYTLDDVLVEEEVPFSFYENFISDIEEEERTRAAAYDRILIPTDPIVRHLGGSHFSILLPSEASLMRVYAIDGSRVRESKFSGTNRMEIDLSGLSAGYYVLLAMTTDGNIYAFKLPK